MNRLITATIASCLTVVLLASTICMHSVTQAQFEPSVTMHVRVPTSTQSHHHTRVHTTTSDSTLYDQCCQDHQGITRADTRQKLTCSNSPPPRVPNTMALFSVTVAPIKAKRTPYTPITSGHLEQIREQQRVVRMLL